MTATSKHQRKLEAALAARRKASDDLIKAGFGPSAQIGMTRLASRDRDGTWRDTKGKIQSDNDSKLLEAHHAANLAITRITERMKGAPKRRKTLLERDQSKDARAYYREVIAMFVRDGSAGLLKKPISAEKIAAVLHRLDGIGVLYLTDHLETFVKFLRREPDAALEMIEASNKK